MPRQREVVTLAPRPGTDAPPRCMSAHAKIMRHAHAAAFSDLHFAPPT